MIKYKIAYSSNPTFQNIEMPFDFEGKNIGDDVSLFNTDFKITQVGSVIQCVNENWVLTLQEVPEKVEIEEGE